MICYFIKYRGPDPNLIYYTIATGKIRQKVRERSKCKKQSAKSALPGTQRTVTTGLANYGWIVI